jgi:hypothetical protein
MKFPTREEYCSMKIKYHEHILTTKNEIFEEHKATWIHNDHYMKMRTDEIKYRNDEIARYESLKTKTDNKEKEFSVLIHSLENYDECCELHFIALDEYIAFTHFCEHRISDIKRLGYSSR